MALRLRSAARVALGTLAFCVLLVLSATVLAATAQPDPVGISISITVLLGAFGVQFWAVQPLLGGPESGSARDVRRHVSAARAALTMALLVEVYLMLGLPVPRDRGTWILWLPLMCMAVATGGSATLMRRRPRAAHALLAGTSLWCVWIMARLAWAALEAQRAARETGVVFSPAYVIVLMLILLLVTSVWFAFWAFRRVYRQAA